MDASPGPADQVVGGENAAEFTSALRTAVPVFGILLRPNPIFLPQHTFQTSLSPAATTPTTTTTPPKMTEPMVKKQKVLTQYDKLAAVTTIVADTGEIAQIKKFSPADATTNPSLLYKASLAPEHQDLVDDALAYGKALKGVNTRVCGRDLGRSWPQLLSHVERDSLEFNLPSVRPNNTSGGFDHEHRKTCVVRVTERTQQVLPSPRTRKTLEPKASPVPPDAARV